MRRITASLIVLASVAVGAMPASAADIDVQSTIDSVTVYPDGASVTRLINVALPAGDATVVARDFPLGLDPSSLRVEGSGGKFTIGSVDARPPRPAPPANLPEIDKRIEALQDQRGALDGAIAAAEARRKFAERFAADAPAGLGDKGEARPLADWRAAFAAVAEEVAAADTAIREAKQKQRDLDREIARLEAERSAKPPRKLEVRIDLNSALRVSSTLRVTYTVRNARWAPLYDARLDTGGKGQKPALELVRRAEITQSTGEDWNGVALAVSTVRTARGGEAPTLDPLIVRYPAPPRPVAGVLAPRSFDNVAPAPMTRAAKVASSESGEPAAEQEAAAEVGAYQVVFHIPGRVSIPADAGAKSLRIGSAAVAPELAVRTVPVRDETAYLEARFKQAEEAPLLPGRVSLYRDGVYVGRGHMAMTGKDEMARLGFGADDKVKVERTTLTRNQGTAGFIVGTSKTDERSFKIKLHNGHDVALKVLVEDQLPVSENEDIQVEMLPATTAPTTRDVDERRGVLQWAFDVAPGENREITLAWRVRWPKDKSVVFVPGHR